VPGCARYNFARPRCRDETASSTAPLAVEQKTQLIPAPTAIPVPEIVKRAEEVTKRLTEFHQLAERGSAIDEIDTRLPELRPKLPRTSTRPSKVLSGSQRARQWTGWHMPGE
jgi:hypothetical protein